MKTPKQTHFLVTMKIHHERKLKISYKFKQGGLVMGKHCLILKYIG